MALSELAREAHGKTNADRGPAIQIWRRATRRQTPNWYLIALSLLALVGFIGFFYWVATLVAYPYELDYGEGVVLWQAQHVMHPASAYKSLTQYPYMVFHYPPLYHLVSLGVSKFTRDLLFAGRMVSMLSSVGICLLLGWIVYRSVPRGAPKTAAACGAVCAAALPCGLDAMQWAPFMRVDMLGLFLTFSGLAVFILARSNTKRYAAFLIFVAAMYTRQTLIAGALTCLLVAAILNSRQAVKFAVFSAAVGGAVLAALFLATHGEVLKHLFLYNRNRYSTFNAVSSINSTFFAMVPVLALAGAAAFRPLVDIGAALSGRTASLRSRLSTSTYRLAAFTLTVHFLLALLVSMTAGKRGSNVNYFLEWNLSACALAGLFIARLLWCRTRGRLSAVAALGYILPVLILAMGAETPFSLLLHSDTDRKTLAAEARDFVAALQVLRNSPEPAMSEDMTLLYKAGKQVPFEPAIIAELVATRRWDETPLLKMVRNHAFSVMLIEDPNSSRYSPAMAQAIKENYTPGEQYGDLTVYRPAGPPNASH